MELFSFPNFVIGTPSQINGIMSLILSPLITSFPASKETKAGPLGPFRAQVPGPRGRPA